MKICQLFVIHVKIVQILAQPILAVLINPQHQGSIQIQTRKTANEMLTVAGPIKSLFFNSIYIQMSGRSESTAIHRNGPLIFTFSTKCRS